MTCCTSVHHPCIFKTFRHIGREQRGPACPGPARVSGCRLTPLPLISLLQMRTVSLDVSDFMAVEALSARWRRSPLISPRGPRADDLQLRELRGLPVLCEAADH